MTGEPGINFTVQQTSECAVGTASNGTGKDMRRLDLGITVVGIYMVVAFAIVLILLR